MISIAPLLFALFFQAAGASPITPGVVAPKRATPFVTAIAQQPKRVTARVDASTDPTFGRALMSFRQPKPVSPHVESDARWKAYLAERAETYGLVNQYVSKERKLMTQDRLDKGLPRMTKEQRTLWERQVYLKAKELYPRRPVA